MRHWKRLPREAVDAPSLQLFKARLNEALGNLIRWVASLPMEEMLELAGVPFQSELFYDSLYFTLTVLHINTYDSSIKLIHIFLYCNL